MSLCRWFITRSGLWQEDFQRPNREGHARPAHQIQGGINNGRTLAIRGGERLGAGGVLCAEADQSLEQSMKCPTMEEAALDLTKQQALRSQFHRAYSQTVGVRPFTVRLSSLETESESCCGCFLLLVTELLVNVPCCPLYTSGEVVAASDA